METRGLPLSTPIDSRGPRLQLGSDPAPFGQDVRPSYSRPGTSDPCESRPWQYHERRDPHPPCAALRWTLLAMGAVRSGPRRYLQIDNSTPRLLYQLIRWMLGSRLSGPSFLCARSLCHGSHTQNHWWPDHRCRHLINKSFEATIIARLSSNWQPATVSRHQHPPAWTKTTLVAYYRSRFTEKLRCFLKIPTPKK